MRIKITAETFLNSTELSLLIILSPITRSLRGANGAHRNEHPSQS